MNCKNVQELLPLYVGRDLEEKREKLVHVHLQSCDDCARAAAEYSESQQLLQMFEPPLFGEEVYSGIRQRVLREIGREPTTPGFAESIANLFRPRIRWAVATALLLAVTVVGFYFIANRTNEQQQAAGQRSTEGPTRQGDPSSVAPPGGVAPGPSPSPTRSDERVASTTGPDRMIREPVSRNRQSQRRKSSTESAGRPKSLPANTPDDRTMTAQAPESTFPSAFPARDPATSEKTLRVEMQTKDRNIRIIWFSPQRTKQDSPGKSSTVNQEVRSYV